MPNPREMARRCAREEGMLVGICPARPSSRSRRSCPRRRRTLCAGLQLRHRRALPLGGRLPAGLTLRRRRRAALRITASLLDKHKPTHAENLRNQTAARPRQALPRRPPPPRWAFPRR
jgi:hypothetical protein